MGISRAGSGRISFTLSRDEAVIHYPKPIVAEWRAHPVCADSGFGATAEAEVVADFSATICKRCTCAARP